MAAETMYAFPQGIVGIARLRSIDAAPFLECTQRSQVTHQPWLSPPVEMDGFEALVARGGDPGLQVMAIWSLEDRCFVGLVQLSQIIHGAFENAFLSYWVGGAFEGQGKMSEALRLVLHYAFRELGLHRVEANIQPGNARSLALVQRLGFVKEGFSEKYLKILGEWRDHERWAIRSEIWAEGGMPAAELPTWRALD
jgi:[ribosomal protein S5]-alanine N-acetyltransferase